MTPAGDVAEGEDHLGDVPSDPRSPAAFALVVALAAIVFAGLVALGIWQLHRLFWKLDLIDRVDRRVAAPAVDAPGRATRASITAAVDEYRHVRASGVFENDHETLVQAATELGAGFWVLTPLRTTTGEIILINRGFVPPDRRNPASRATGEIAGPVTVTGLLRMSEPKGGFLRRNDPAADRWYSRDVAAIAVSRGLKNAAPFFIDADATPNLGDYPVGGLTVIAFHNNHMIYAFTWFSLACMLAATVAWQARGRWRRPKSARIARG